MLKLISFIKRAPGLTPEEFGERWCRHAKLVRRYAAALGIRRYVQNVPLPDAVAQDALRSGRGLAPIDCDGSASLWWDDMASHRAAHLTAEGAEALRVLKEDEAQFVDIAHSQFWYAVETEVAL